MTHIRGVPGDRIQVPLGVALEAALVAVSLLTKGLVVLSCELRIGARAAPVVGARVARIRTAQRRVGSSQRRVGGAQHLQHGLPVRHRRHRQVDGLHAVVVDGVHVRAAVY